MTRSFAAVLLLVAVSSPALAQFQPPTIDPPDVSPAASVRQVVGVTEMEIDYHRPGVNGRTIWGGLVPYDQVWRAGANENTTISFSTPVTVAGTPLPAGRYGLHMVPRRERWIVAFSKVDSNWGSFSYDATEDAARIEVTPVAAPMEERLSYRFDDPGDDSVVVTMRWERLAVPFEVAVDLPSTVLADVRRQLRGLQQFGPRAWSDAARLSLALGGDLDEALRWSDRSLAGGRQYANLTTKAMVLERRDGPGDAAAAAALRAEADPMASEVERNAFGYALMGEGKLAEAIATFERNVKLHPESWNVHDSLAEAYAAKGEKAKARASYQRAAALVKDPAQKSRIEAELAKLQR